MCCVAHKPRVAVGCGRYRVIYALSPIAHHCQHFRLCILASALNISTPAIGHPSSRPLAMRSGTHSIFCRVRSKDIDSLILTFSGKSERRHTERQKERTRSPKQKRGDSQREKTKLEKQSISTTGESVRKTKARQKERSLTKTAVPTTAAPTTAAPRKREEQNNRTPTSPSSSHLAQTTKLVYFEIFT